MASLHIKTIQPEFVKVTSDMTTVTSSMIVRDALYVGHCSCGWVSTRSNCIKKVEECYKAHWYEIHYPI